MRNEKLFDIFKNLAPDVVNITQQIQHATEVTA